MIRVGYLGPEATFTNMAVSRFFPEAEHVPYRTIPDCIDAAANENVDFAVVPLENAIEGSVNITVDYLVHEQPLSIVGEITVPIQRTFTRTPAVRRSVERSIRCTFSPTCHCTVP